jgi:hypothetical protein
VHTFYVRTCPNDFDFAARKTLATAYRESVDTTLHFGYRVSSNVSDAKRRLCLSCPKLVSKLVAGNQASQVAHLVDCHTLHAYRRACDCERLKLDKEVRSTVRFR